MRSSASCRPASGVGDLARTLGLESEYPVYALIDTPTEAELHAWWRHGLVRVPRAALKAVDDRRRPAIRARSGRDRPEPPTPYR